MDQRVSPLAVADPEIAEVQDLVTGEVTPSHVAIGTDYGKAMELRMSLRQSIAAGAPLYACPLCGTPVHLVSRKEARRFFFRHHMEDGRCPARTRGVLNEAEIAARKYNGAKESQDHIRMKAIIEKSLRCDPRFSGIKVEAVMKGQDRASWRKPDVQAVYQGIPVAFEIQLSTTFLRVIAERRAFYQRNGCLLVWVFKSFDADSARLTQEDIFFSNNRNIFLASEETLKSSLQSGKLMLDCRWAEPFIQRGKIATRWGRRMAAFDELAIDRDRLRLFLFDYDREAAALQVSPDGQDLRADFEAFWLSRRNNDPWDQEAWNLLRRRFDERGLSLPIEPNWGGAPSHLLNALYSAREGRPVGWRFRTLADVAHQIVDGHKKLSRAFIHAVKVYERSGQILQEDREGKWRSKVEACASSLAANSPEYAPERRFDRLVDFLFPELRWGAEPPPG